MFTEFQRLESAQRPFRCVKASEHNQSRGDVPLEQCGTRKQVAGGLGPLGSIYHQSMQIKHDDLINQVINKMMESKTDYQVLNPRIQSHHTLEGSLSRNISKVLSLDQALGLQQPGRHIHCPR